MVEQIRVLAVTGNDVVAFTVPAGDPAVLLRGVGARCIAVDPPFSGRVYVGTFDRGLYASDDGGRSWRQDERGLTDRRVTSVAVSPHREGGV